MLIKRALKGGLPIVKAAKAIQEELLSGPTGTTGTTGTLKKTALIALGLAMQTYGEALQNEQEALILLSDIVMDTFAADSVTLRAAQAKSAGAPDAELHAAAADVFVHDAALRIEVAARTLLGSMLAGDAQRTALAGLRRILKPAPVNTIALRRLVADAVANERGYPF